MSIQLNFVLVKFLLNILDIHHKNLVTTFIAMAIHSSTRYGYSVYNMYFCVITGPN